MAQFRYRLQTLLDQKEQAQESAQKALATVQAELRTEEAELDACRRGQQACEERLRNARTQQISRATGELLIMRRDYIRRLQDECNIAIDATRAQELRVTEVEERVFAARDALAAAARDLEVLEKHRDRVKRKFLSEVERKEALEGEEMANIMFQHRRDKGED